jgi:hypothetical protein
MQVDRCAELFGTFQDRPEELVVEIAAAIMAVDDGSGEFLPAYSPLKLLGGLVRRCGWQGGETAEARRMLLDRICDEVVGISGKRDRFGALIVRRRARSAIRSACRCRRRPFPLCACRQGRKAGG